MKAVQTGQLRLISQYSYRDLQIDSLGDLHVTVDSALGSYHGSSRYANLTYATLSSSYLSPSPSPAASPTPTAQPTSDPTKASISNPTTNPTQQPTNTPSTVLPSRSPTVPELSWLAIAPLLIGALSVATLLRHRKTSNLKQ